MVEIEIPGYGKLEVVHLICDYSGTLSVDGKLLPGIKERLERLSSELSVHVITSDTHGMAEAELSGIDCSIKILTGKDHDVQKENYLRSLNGNASAAIGNGNNDARLLKAARIGVCVCMEEGCSVAALKAADIIVKSAIDALELFIRPKRLIATLRY